MRRTQTNENRERKKQRIGRTECGSRDDSWHHRKGETQGRKTSRQPWEKGDKGKDNDEKKIGKGWRN